MPREHIERLFDLARATAFDGVAEQHLAAEIAAVGIEVECAPVAESSRGCREAISAAQAEESVAKHLDTLVAGTPPPAAIAAFFRQPPSGEDVGQRDDVALRVSTIDAERVQLHQLAGVVLVDALELAFRARGAG